MEGINDLLISESKILEIKSIGEVLEDFDGLVHESLTLRYCSARFAYDDNDVLINQSEFLDQPLYDQYKNLINDFGKKLHDLSKIHLEQLNSLKNEHRN